MTTKMDDAEAADAMILANKVGLGLVRVSSKRYIVVMPTGAEARRSGDRPWTGRMGYKTVTRPLEYVRAAEVATTLMLARQRGTHAALENAVEDLDPALRPEWQK